MIRLVVSTTVPPRRGRWSILFAVIAAGCGRVHFAPLTDVGELADSTMPGDGSVPFGTPRPVTELNSISEDDDPTLTADMLEVYFASRRSGGMGLGDIWSSTRASVLDAWAPPVPVTVLNTSQDEIAPEITLDGLTLYFARGGTTDRDIYVSTRGSRQAPWSAPVLVPELSSSGDDYAAAPSPDHLVIVVTRGPSGVNSHLRIATRASETEAWTTPERIAELDDPMLTESQAWLDDETIYFTVDTPTDQAIWMAPRTGPTTFGSPVPVVELDLEGSESDPWLDPTRRTIFFEHDDDIWMAER